MTKCLKDYLSVSGDGFTVFHGSNLDVLPLMADNSVDSIVTDPPYELGFMGKSWDSSGIAYSVELWAECLRVLKPGGHLLAFGGSRTWHRLAVAIEDAGFDVRDSIAWLYGSGFPKSLDISKAIDKRTGENKARQLRFTAWMRSTGVSQADCADAIRNHAKNIETARAMAQHYFSDKQQPAIPTADVFDSMRHLLPNIPEDIERLVAERTGIEWTAYKNRKVIGQKTAGMGSGKTFGMLQAEGQNQEAEKTLDITAPATPEAEKWAGWGTALKPAFEPVVVARKPLIGTVAENVLTWGVGGLNIDGSRITSQEGEKFDRPATYTGEHKAWNRPWKSDPKALAARQERINISAEKASTLGRWPANIILDEYTAELLDEQSGVSKSPTKDFNYVRSTTPPGYELGRAKAGRTVEGVNYGDSGGASRFFYVAKASKRDRNEGLDELPLVSIREGMADTERMSYQINTHNGSPEQPRQNFHPTVKPTDLMRYLIKLVTPAGGTVLDPFTGSGSTGKAALLDGYNFVGIELTADYLPIIEGRLKWAAEQANKQEEEKEERLF